MRHLLPFAALSTAGPDDDPAFLGGAVGSRRGCRISRRRWRNPQRVRGPDGERLGCAPNQRRRHPHIGRPLENPTTNGRGRGLMRQPPSIPAARPRSARVSQTAGFVEEQESDPRSGSPSARLAAHGHGGPAPTRNGLGELAEAVSCVRWCLWRAIWASRGRRLQSLAMARRGRESARRRRPVRRAVPPLGAGEAAVAGALRAHEVEVGAAGAAGAVHDRGTVGRVGGR